MATAPPLPIPVTLDEVCARVRAGERVELVDGEVVHQTMTRAEHGSAQMMLGGILHGFHRSAGGPRGPGGWWLMTEVDVIYPKTSELFRHDAMGFRRERVGARPAMHPVTERADWVCEILSPSTARSDLVKKYRTLHAHEVPHYWVLDPVNETLTVFERGELAYTAIVTGGVGDVVRAPPFDAVEVVVAELFGHDV